MTDFGGMDLFDLFRSESWRLRENDHRRLGQVREHFYRKAQGGLHAEDHKEQCHCQDDCPVMQC